MNNRENNQEIMNVIQLYNFSKKAFLIEKKREREIKRDVLNIA